MAVIGGASIAQQCVQAGLIGEMRIHIAHLLLGAGTRLFENVGSKRSRWKRARVRASPAATHFIFRVRI